MEIRTELIGPGIGHGWHVCQTRLPEAHGVTLLTCSLSSSRVCLHEYKPPPRESITGGELELESPQVFDQRSDSSLCFKRYLINGSLICDDIIEGRVRPLR